MVIIAMLFGCYDLTTIILLFSIHACMNFFGYMMEEINYLKKKEERSWVAFYFGCFAGFVPWLVIFIFIISGGSQSEIPGFVYGILICFLFFWIAFPINMALQY